MLARARHSSAPACFLSMSKSSLCQPVFQSLYENEQENFHLCHPVLCVHYKSQQQHSYLMSKQSVCQPVLRSQYKTHQQHFHVYVNLKFMSTCIT